MYRALTCLAFEHNLALVGFAAAICIVGTATCLRVLQISLRSEGVPRMAWLGAATIAGGGSVWATHFISMIAYDPGVVVGYAAWPIFASLAMALAVPGAGFALYLIEGRWVPLGAGILVGLGIAGMHYVGMTGVIVPGDMHWSASLIAASIVYSCVFAMLAFWLVQRFEGTPGVLWGMAALSGAVVLLHFTGMGALTIVPNPTVAEPALLISTELLAGAAIVVTAFILVVAFVCIGFERRITREQEAAAERIRHMAYHDPLSGLPNRAHLAETLPDLLRNAAAQGEEVAVLAIDLDRFKQVNDIFGHQSGDALICALAGIMKEQVGPDDIVARVGGDEFVVVQAGAAQPGGAEALCARLLNAACRDIDVGRYKFRTSISIGVALFPRDGTDASVLHSNGDAALYRAKEDGRGVARFFAPEMDLALRERRLLQVELRDALARNEFRVFYQPQVETRTGVVSGFEALVRWEHPERGLLNPGSFIEAAEENGFIVELGEYVLRTACAEAATWDSPLSVSVNLSPAQFRHGDLAGLVGDVLRETGLEATRLELEITEGVLIQDTARALDILGRIKKLGVAVAMDDFGTGYSSLAYLQAFPFDRIKIDRSFIAALEDNPQSQAIVRAIIGLGRGLNVPITAEGVENDVQQAFLAELYCDEVQGYLVGKPQPIEQLAVHLRRKGKDSRAAVA